MSRPRRPVRVVELGYRRVNGHHVFFVRYVLGGEERVSYGAAAITWLRTNADLVAVNGKGSKLAYWATMLPPSIGVLTNLDLVDKLVERIAKAVGARAVFD